MLEPQLPFGPSGDGHDPVSIYQDACLLRLIDAALSPQPELNFTQSYHQLLSKERQKAEEALGFLPETLTCNNMLSTGMISPVSQGSPEFVNVETIFLSRSRSDYHPDTKFPWYPQVVAIERVQNLAQLKAVQTRKDAIVKGLVDAGAMLPAASSMRWGFHGAPHAAIHSIVTDPVSGFKAVMVDRSIWGTGLYFARDACYSYYGTGKMKPPGFCTAEDGVIKMVLCLLATGLPCAADENMKLLHTSRRQCATIRASTQCPTPRSLCWRRVSQHTQRTSSHSSIL